MKKEDVDFSKFPKEPGVYLFRDARGKILYIGKATFLQDRVRSYFSERLIKDRGMRMVDAVAKTRKIEVIPTESVLDSFLLESSLIKKYQPTYNVLNKDNKSFPFICITKEDFPRILVVRGRELENDEERSKYSHIFGPFPRGSFLREALKIVRKIFPYRDKCIPNSGKKCFNAQLRLCPGVCEGTISSKDYKRNIRDLVKFFKGEKKKLYTDLEKRMKQFAKEEKFEKADEIKKRLFALKHIQDVNLIKKEFAEGGGKDFRIEGYDISHLSGKDAVGVMVVIENGEANKKEYRLFNIKEAKGGDDLGALEEVLTRRFARNEWRFPNLIVVDGGKQQLNRVKKILDSFGIQIPLVSVVKDERHRPREILGDKKYAHLMEDEIILTNQESHRFAISSQRKKRGRKFKK